MEWEDSIKAVLFDFSGTLVDGRLDVSKSRDKAVAILKGRGYNVSRQQYDGAIELSLDVMRARRVLEMETPYEEVIKDLLTRLGIEATNGLIKTIEDSDYAHYKWRLRPGVRNVVTSLSPRMQLGVVSNSWSDSVLKVLRKSRLLGHFNAIVLSKDVGYRKPNRRIFLRAIQELGVRPNQVAFVGDNYRDDVLGPASVGIVPLWRDGSRLCGLTDIPRELLRVLPRIRNRVLPASGRLVSSSTCSGRVAVHGHGKGP